MAGPAAPIRTARLLLRPFTPEDFDALYAMQSRPDVTRYLYWGPRSADQVREALAQRIDGVWPEATGGLHAFAMVLTATGQVIGEAMLKHLSTEHSQGEIGYIVHPDHHRRGYAREAALEMLRLGFDHLNLHRIIGRCDGRNAVSARLMEKLGMRREAHFRQNEFVRGVWCDELVYAMLAEEWAQLTNIKVT
jgi:RimJ/RimL family protein N-acetyltransferase